MLVLPPPPVATPLLVGFSGGLDSSVLLHRLATDTSVRAHGLRALHVHHGLHPSADDWVAHCQAFCEERGIVLEVARVRVEPASGDGLEAAARDARYRAFAEALQPGETLVTAHHLGDQAETFLLRALRASGVDGLAAMRPWRPFARGWQWRPLLGIPRVQLHACAVTHGLRWLEDPGNERLEHDRNFLRHRVLPLLKQRWPHAEAAFAASAALAAESADLLADEDALALARVRSVDPQALSAMALLALPAARRARVLRRWLHSLRLPPLPAEGVRRIESDLLRAGTDGEAEFAWQDAVVSRWRNLLHARRRLPGLPPDFAADWQAPAPLRLPTGDELSFEGPAHWPAALRVTARRGGERLRQTGRSHSQALKKLLQATGVPPWERADLPLLWDPGGELLAAGDRLYSAGFERWLREHDTRLRWRRAR